MKDWHPLARSLGAVGALAIVVTSLTPAGHMPDVRIPDWSEHFIAYAGTSFLLCAAFRGRTRPVLALVLALSVVGGVMELLQQFSPGRDTSLSDFFFSMSGAALGAALAVVAAEIIGD